jgi:glutaredoxin
MLPGAEARTRNISCTELKSYLPTHTQVQKRRDIPGFGKQLMMEYLNVLVSRQAVGGKTQSDENRGEKLLKLYQADWCPYCARVRAKMAELGIDYICVDVPRAKPERKELIEISGQAGIPTLVCDDGTVIADDDDKIIEYLEKHYGTQTNT